MKKVLSIVLLAWQFSQMQAAVTTDTLNFYIQNFLIPSNGGGPICLGDTLAISTAFGCICGDAKYINEKYFFNSPFCNSISCEATGVSTPVFQGPGIVSESFVIPSAYDCNTGITWSAIIAPQSTASYTIAWDEYKRENYASCGGYDLVYAFHFQDTLHIPVQALPVPEFSISEPVAHCGEQITLNFENCDNNYGYIIQSSCGTYYTGSVFGNNCSDPDLDLLLPNYTTTLNMRAKYRSWSAPLFCTGEWSDYQQIQVQEMANADACNDPSIHGLEDSLADPNAINAGDYHYYESEEVICNAASNGPRDCDIPNIWSFLKSSADNQAPILSDYPPMLNLLPLSSIPRSILMLARLGAQFLFPPNTAPLSNCQTLNLPISPEREILAAGLAIAQHNGLINLCPSANGVNLSAEPIKVVIDEGCSCITNYTLPGHVLYPGKVRRCLVLEDCDTFKIKTTGVGFHFCGDNIIGRTMRVANEIVGGSTFNSVTQRFIYNFNH